MKTIEVPLTVDEEILCASAARFAARTWPIEKVRAHADADMRDEVTSYVRAAADLGWFAMLVPEELSGATVSGAGVRDAALVALERGRALQPGPFVANNVVADALSRGECDGDLRKVASELATGDRAACWTLTDPARDLGAAGLVVQRSGSGARIDGIASVVEHADIADWILAVARSEDGLRHFLVPTSTPGVTVEPIQAIDVTRRYHRVRFDGVNVASSSIIGEPKHGLGLVDRSLQLAAVLSAADMVGAMSANLEMTVEYAKSRVAFGRPIGSFQAVKHLLAETSLLVEESRSILLAAVRADGGADALKLGTMAKAFVGDAAVDVGQNCFQVFGGVAFTWEHDHHLFMRRTTMDSALYGSANWHRDRLCDLYDWPAGES